MTEQSTQPQPSEPTNDDSLIAAALRLVSESASLTGQIVLLNLYRFNRACAEVDLSRECRTSVRRTLIESGHMIINGSAESVLGSDFQAAMVATSKGK